MRFLDRLSHWKGRSVFVYGAGECGANARRMLEQYFGVTVHGFIDTHKRGGFEGLDIQGPDDFLARRPSDARIAVASEYWREIAAFLDAKGFSAYETMPWSPLTWRNYGFFKAKLGLAPASSEGRCEPAPTPAPAPAPTPGASDEAEAAVERLLSVPFNDDCLVDLALTSRCNLKCGYCPHNVTTDRDWKDTDAALIDAVQDLLEPYGRVRIELGGGQGETTILKNWQERANTFLERGGRLRITTNLSRALSWAEADTLSRFYRVNVSMDAIEADLIKQVRVGANIANIVYNIGQIRAAAVAAGREAPDFNIQAVVSERTIFQADRVAAMAVALGIRNVRLIAISGVPFDPKLRNINVLEPGDAREALAVLERAYRIGLDNNLCLEVDDDVSDHLKQCLNRSPGIENAPPAWDAAPPPAPSGMTRLCFDPWTHLIFVDGGEVRSCCYGNPSFKPDFGTDDANAIFNAEPIQALRKGLLTGDLDAFCTRCVAKPLVPTAILRRHVERLVKTG